MAAERATPAVAQRSTRATWALASAVVAAVAQIPFVPIPYGGFIFGAGAVILGVLGARDAASGMRGRGLALAAIVAGVLSFAFELVQIFRSF